MLTLSQLTRITKKTVALQAWEQPGQELGLFRGPWYPRSSSAWAATPDHDILFLRHKQRRPKDAKSGFLVPSMSSCCLTPVVTALQCFPVQSRPSQQRPEGTPSSHVTTD